MFPYERVRGIAIAIAIAIERYVDHPREEVYARLGDAVGMAMVLAMTQRGDEEVHCIVRRGPRDT